MSGGCVHLCSCNWQRRGARASHPGAAAEIRTPDRVNQLGRLCGRREVGRQNLMTDRPSPLLLRSSIYYKSPPQGRAPCVERRGRGCVASTCGGGRLAAALAGVRGGRRQEAQRGGDRQRAAIVVALRNYSTPPRRLALRPSAVYTVAFSIMICAKKGREHLSLGMVASGPPSFLLDTPSTRCRPDRLDGRSRSAAALGTQACL